MAINRYFKLFLNAGAASPLVINVNQYDKDELWYFTLLSETGEQYYPNAAAIVGKKNDGNLIANAATVDGRGYVNVTETEQMTAAPGVNHFELLIDGQVHGTANFIVLVEPSPTEGGVVSDSDLSLIQQAMDSISPAVIAQKVADWMDENLTPTTPVVDASLTVQGAAADSAKVGQELSDLKSQIAQLEAIPRSVKLAMDNLFTKVAYLNDPSTDYATFHAWASAINVLSISAVYTQSGVVYDNASLDSLKANLVVTAYYDDGTSSNVTGYALSGTLEEGTSTITVTYSEKTTTFNVDVTPRIMFQVANQSIDKNTPAIDTELDILGTDRDFTIVLDAIQPSAVTTGSNARLMVCFSSETNWKGIIWGASSSGSAYQYGWYSSSSGGSTFPRNAVNGRFRLVYMHEAGSDKAITYAKYNNNTVVYKELESPFIAQEAHLMLGGVFTSDTTQNWVGTITKAIVYATTLSESEINAFLE